MTFAEALKKISSNLAKGKTEGRFDSNSGESVSFPLDSNGNYQPGEPILEKHAWGQIIEMNFRLASPQNATFQSLTITTKASDGDNEGTLEWTNFKSGVDTEEKGIGTANLEETDVFVDLVAGQEYANQTAEFYLYYHTK